MIQTIPITEIYPSKTNPRRTVEGPALNELTLSVKEHGVLQPILVRRNGKGYEVVAGHRRFAAARLAELTDVPATVRELTDQQVLEIQLIENLQRSDLHPLEEAEGYRQLIATKKYDVARIAERIGRSIKYVYDRVKLLSLTKAAQKLFLEDRISAGHAIILARLSPKDQERATEPAEDGFRGEGPLFQFDHGLFTDEQQDAEIEARAKDPHHGMKTKSVRELQAWVDKHVRFDATASDVPDLFPETFLAVRKAQDEADKIIPITHDYQVQPEARDGNRIYGPMSWRRADGDESCAHSVTGVIVIGPGRGEAFKVCTAKEKCKTHWGDWQKERAKRSKTATAKGSSGEERWKIEEEKRKEQQAKDEASRARFKKALPAIHEQLAAAIAKQPIGSVGAFVIRELEDCRCKASAAEKFIPRGKTADDLLRFAAFLIYYGVSADDWNGHRAFPERVKGLGLNVAKILDRVAPIDKPAKAQTSAKPAPAKKAKKK